MCHSRQFAIEYIKQNLHITVCYYRVFVFSIIHQRCPSRRCRGWRRGSGRFFFIDYRGAAAPRQIIHNGAAAVAWQRLFIF
jgi:hypothetical protein